MTRPASVRPTTSRSLFLACALACWLVGCAAFGRRASIVYNAVAAEVAPDNAIVEIERSFIERYKDRVTISTAFTVDAAKSSAAPSMFDGDLHIAGRAPEIGLRLVAEIKNAAAESAAVALVNRAEASRRPVRFTGVWRLWPEHAIGPEQQGDSISRLKTPFPDHIFEIHPLTRADGIGLLGTFHLVEGYKPGSAAKTFGIYEGAKCSIELSPTTATFTISSWLYNDVHFLLEPSGDPHLVKSDGRFITAAARDLDGNLLVPKLRMVLVAGTEPERVIRALPPGARQHVWGLPRVNFAEISRRIKESTSNPAVLEGSLPYEIIVLGVYPNDQ